MISCSNCGSLSPHNYKQEWLVFPRWNDSYYLCSYNCEKEFYSLTDRQRKLTVVERAEEKEKRQQEILQLQIVALKEQTDKLRRAVAVIEAYPANWDDPVWIKQAYKLLEELFSKEDDYDEWDYR